MSLYLHKCTHGQRICCPAVAELRSVGGRHSARTPVIDLHCHTLSIEVERLVGACVQKRTEASTMVQTQGQASVSHNARMIATWFPKLSKVDVRLHDMDEMGVSIQVLSPSPTQYYYWAESELAERLVQVQNEEISETCRQFPTRFLGLGNVSLQHPELALRQMAYATQVLGLKGFEISSSVNGKDVTEPEFDYFWEAVDALGCMVFLHPLGTSLGERLAGNYLSNIIGQPIETTIVLSKLIFQGVLDKYPKLRLCAAHGGGYLPFYIGRSDHGFHVRPEASGISKPPSEYLRQIYFDSVVYSANALRALIDQVGISQLVIGTDYPFDMGYYAVQEIIADIVDLTPQDRQSIGHLNARRLLGLAN